MNCQSESTEKFAGHENTKTTVNIKQFAGQTIAVYTYGWIYKGTYDGAMELAMGTKVDEHITYLVKEIQT